MTMLIMYGVLAIGVSYLCSMLEASLLSLPRSYVESLVERGNSTGKALSHMKDNIDRPLAAILTLNTIAHTVGAAGVGAQAAVVFGSAAVGVTSAIMTLLILVFSEIIPKTLGAVYAKGLAGFTAITLRIMIIISLPIIIPLEWMNKLLGFPKHQSRISRAELLATIRMGKESGALERNEFKVTSNLIRLSEIKINEVLTPRMVVFSLPADSSIKAALREHPDIKFSRIPVYDGHPEQVIGYVSRHDMHATPESEQGTVKLKSLVKRMPFLPEYATVDKTLEQFIKEGHHIALVVDEYGGMEGIVTLEDLLETLLGEEIVDETDPHEDMQVLARERAQTGNSDL